MDTVFVITPGDVVGAIILIVVIIVLIIGGIFYAVGHTFERIQDRHWRKSAERTRQREKQIEKAEELATKHSQAEEDKLMEDIFDTYESMEDEKDG